MNTDVKEDKSVVKPASQPVAKAADKTKVRVVTRGVATRYRAGMAFSSTPAEVEVNASQLAALRADKYLVVEVQA